MESTAKTEHRRRPAWESAGLARHELPRLRIADLQPLLNLSQMSVWRLRQMPGFPKPDALGRFDRAEVLAFVAALSRDDMRANRAKLDAKHMAEGAATERRAAKPAKSEATAPHTPSKRGSDQRPGSGAKAKTPRRGKARA